MLRRTVILTILLAQILGSRVYAGSATEDANYHKPMDREFIADKGIAFGNSGPFEYFDDDEIVPNQVPIVQEALRSAPEQLTVHDLKSRVTFEHITPSQFLAVLMTGRLNLRLEDGSQISNENYEELMKANAYPELRKQLNPVELKQFIPLIDLALTESTVLGGNKSHDILTEYSESEHATAWRIDHLITNLLMDSEFPELFSEQFPRLFVKRVVSGRADCPNVVCNEAEFARAFFSSALTFQDRRMAALMEAKKEPLRNRFSLVQWLTICVKAMEIENSKSSSYAGAVLQFAEWKLANSREEWVFHGLSDKDRTAALQLTERLIQLGTEHAPQDIGFAANLILRLADDSVLDSRPNQSNFDLDFNNMLAKVSTPALDEVLREKIRLLVRSKEWHRAPESTLLTIQLLREAIIESNKLETPVLPGVKLARKSCAELLFKTRDGRRRF